MVAKSFPREQVHTKIFIKFSLVENFLCLHNYFLENRSLPKFSSNFFWSKIFYGCKIISSKTCSYQNFHQIFFVENFLLLQNHFLENRFLTKVSAIFFGRKFFMVAKSFPRKQVLTKYFRENCLVENFSWLQNHFLENNFLTKIKRKFW
jgi:hypothetical protein